MKYGFRPVVSRLHLEMPNSSCHDDDVPMPCAFPAENARIAAAARIDGNVRRIMECPPSYRARLPSYELHHQNLATMLFPLSAGRNTGLSGSPSSMRKAFPGKNQPARKSNPSRRTPNT